MLHDTRFWWAETDGWLGKFVKTFFEMSHYYRGVNDASSIIRRIDKLLANRSIFSVVTASEKFTAICEILDMTFWKHRYEMYSAWVFTCIAESVSDLGLSYNVLGGVLQFKFSGALLARVNIPDVEFEIWAEKRYEAENLVGEGRKKHIQPDYSIMKRCNGAGEACLLIECKQYKKSNSRNFAIAVNDYARSRPDANVLLVNYGPISRNLSMRIGSDVRRRYRGYEKMKPLTARRAEFVRDVRDILDATIGWAVLARPSDQSRNMIR